MIPLWERGGNLILRAMRILRIAAPVLGMALVASSAAAAQPADRPVGRCMATLHPVDEPLLRTGALAWAPGDSAAVNAPLGSRDAVGCRHRPLADGQSGDRSMRRLRGAWPELRLVAAGGVPDSRGDGALWAGRGLSTRLRGGLLLDLGPFHAALVPELWTTANRPYDLLSTSAISGDTSRSPLASPFYQGPHTLDLPSRLGVAPLRVLTPGQSALWVTVRTVDLGLSSSNSWWGPGQRDGLLLGPGAAGVPRAFVRTTRPIDTRMGRWQAEWLLGTLTESRWFDATPANDRRSFSAARLEWSPPGTAGFLVGAARAVQRVTTARLPTGRLGDVLRSTAITGGDQMAALYAALNTPGLHAYAEIASSRPPNGIRTLLAQPGDDRGYQLGVERRIVRGRTRWRILADVANTDPGISLRDRPARDFYAGAAAPHGWTHRGQLLGAGIGPGGTSQWLSVDRQRAEWMVGGYAERVRWNNEVLTRLYLPTIFRHDVTVRGGIRGALRLPMGAHTYRVALDASWGTRLNYLFQNTTWIRDYRTVDIRIPQLQLVIAPG